MDSKPDPQTPPRATCGWAPWNRDALSRQAKAASGEDEQSPLRTVLDLYGKCCRCGGIWMKRELRWKHYRTGNLMCEECHRNPTTTLSDYTWKCAFGGTVPAHEHPDHPALDPIPEPYKDSDGYDHDCVRCDAMADHDCDTKAIGERGTCCVCADHGCQRALDERAKHPVFFDVPDSAPCSFALFGGEAYYPGGGWYDFKGVFEDVASAKEEIRNRWDFWHIINIQTQKCIEYYGGTCYCEGAPPATHLS